MNIPENILYLKVISFSKKLVERYKTALSEGDIANEAYLKCLEADTELTYNNLTLSAKSIAMGSLNDLIQKNDWAIANEQFRFCKNCKDDKPIGAFGITIRNKTGKRVFQSYCRECITEMSRAKRISMGIQPKKFFEYPEGATEKEKRAIYHRQWQIQNREYLSKKRREWYYLNKEKIFAKCGLSTNIKQMGKADPVKYGRISPIAMMNWKDFSTTMSHLYSEISH